MVSNKKSDMIGMDKINMRSNKTCAAFYKHTNVRSGNRIFPCCRYKEPVAVFDGNLNKILDLPEMQKLRETPVEDNPNCAKCIHEETLGKNSLRALFNAEYDSEDVK